MNIRTLTECLDTKLKTEAFEYEFDDELDYIMDDDSLSDEEKEQAIKDLYNKYNIDEGWSDEDISSIPFSELISGNWFGAKESDYGGTVDKSFFSKWGDTEDTKFSDEDPESLNEDISKDKVQEALQILIDNGVDEDVADTVLQEIGHALLDTEPFLELFNQLFPE